MGSITVSELVPGEDVLVTSDTLAQCLGPGISHPSKKKYFKDFFWTVQIYSWVSAPVFRALA